MKTLLAILAAACLLPTVAAAAPTYDVTLSPGQDIQVDLGCVRGYIEGSRWNHVVYDQKNHERISYNISKCTGGFIRGQSTVNDRFWRADIRPDGSMAGQDLDGAKWRYDPRTRTYVNLTTGRSCAHTTLRHVCSA